MTKDKWTKPNGTSARTDALLLVGTLVVVAVTWIIVLAVSPQW